MPFPAVRVYALFLVLALGSFGDRIAAAFALEEPTRDWAIGGITYAGYNIIGCVIVLPVLRDLTSTRGAIVSGLIAGPLAMAPAILFFVCMVASIPLSAPKHCLLTSCSGRCIFRCFTSHFRQ